MIFAPEEIKEMISLQDSSFSFYSTGDIGLKYRKRENFRTGTSWHIPTQKLIDLMSKYGPLVSVGSGFGYTESIAMSQGVDVIATDLEPTDKNGWCRNGKFHCEVEEIDAKEAVKKYKDRNVFMAWPPYDNPMAYEVALNMEAGRHLIYIGEGGGGCTGDDDFFGYLNSNFEEIDYLSIPKWFGLHDRCIVLKKIK